MENLSKTWCRRPVCGAVGLFTTALYTVPIKATDQESFLVAFHWFPVSCDPLTTHNALHGIGGHVDSRQMVVAVLRLVVGSNATVCVKVGSGNVLSSQDKGCMFHVWPALIWQALHSPHSTNTHNADAIMSFYQTIQWPFCLSSALFLLPVFQVSFTWNMYIISLTKNITDVSIITDLLVI